MVESWSSVRAQQPLLTRGVVSIWIWKIGGIFPCIHNATVNDIKSNEKLFTQHEKSTRRMENCWWHLICGETATDTRLFKVQAHKSAVLQWRHMNAMSPISSLPTPGFRFQAAWIMPHYGDRCFFWHILAMVKVAMFLTDFGYNCSFVTLYKLLGFLLSISLLPEVAEKLLNFRPNTRTLLFM